MKKDDPSKITVNSEETSQMLPILTSEPAKHDIIENLLYKVGIGKYQYISYSIIGACWMADGAEIMCLSLVNYLIVHVFWFRSLEDVAQLGSLMFFGYFIGSILSGIISDNIGRKIPFAIYTALMFVTSIISAFSPNYQFFLITRPLYGIALGLSTPVSASYLIEITQADSRGKNLMLVSSLFSFGELMGLFLGKILNITDPKDESWRALLIWNAVPLLLSSLGALWYMHESPRYAVIKDIDEAVTIFEAMHKENHGKPMGITEGDKKEIEVWRQANKDRMKSKSIWTMSHLFEGKNRINTPLLWVCWWVQSFSYYGAIYVLPLVLSQIMGEDEDSGIDYYTLAIAVIGEIPAYYILYLIIEIKHFGRKNTVVGSFFLGGLCFFGACYFSKSLFIVFIFLAKFFVNGAFQAIYPYTNELYPTSYRTTGLGFCSASSRLGGLVMPWLIIYSMKSSPLGPFVVFGISCVVAGIASLLISHDTTGIPLDTETIEEEYEKKYT